MYQSTALKPPHLSSISGHNRMLCKSLITLITLIFGISACTSTPAKEEENWKRNKIDMEESIKIYPNLKVALVANRTQATDMWTKAQAISDEKARLKAMKAANGTMRQVVGPLRRIEMRLESVERDINRLSQKRLTGAAVMRREQALTTLNRDLERARQELHNISFQDPMQAKMFLDKQYNQSTGLRNRSKSIHKRFTNIKRSRVRAKAVQRDIRRMQNKKTSAQPRRTTVKPTTRSTTRRPSKPVRRPTRSKSKRR